ncbi:MAG: hypothetical protein IH598_02190 [Bacteroidales bacterium]|nr:hypothetical protein [Bacteroidales bacterium]
MMALSQKIQLISLRVLLLCLTFVVTGINQTLPAQNPVNFTIKGYVKELPLLTLDKEFSDPEFTNVLHNRLNMRLDISSDFHIALEGRNRLFYNEIFVENPAYRDFIGYDPGLMDLSWTWFSKGKWLGNTMVDRFYLDWRKENLQVRIGRQRINWGINFVSNPNDLFNTFSFFDFDYDERPGADAIRVQYFIDHLSQVQFAISPARYGREMVAAGMYNFNQNNFDFQTLAGYYKNRLAIGLGWAGNIGHAGFKGEGTWFYDLEKIPGLKRGNLVASVGMDYLFGSGTFGVIELLYNGGFERGKTENLRLIQPLQPDNIMFSEFAATISINHPFSPILNGVVSVMALPDNKAIFMSPGITWSVLTDLDFGFLAQIFTAGETSAFSEAGSLWMITFKYSF